MKILAILSPTWALADYLKIRYEKNSIIRMLNSVYLWISIASTGAVAVYQKFLSPAAPNDLYTSLPYLSVILWSYFLLSRANEIFYAFLKDAFDKMEPVNVESASSQPPVTNSNMLTPAERIKLSLKSYLELILNFALLYALMSKSLWKKGSIAPTAITDSVYFSGVTITTTGYGDITPCHWYPQFLSVYEVFCGVLLLVVCFAIYTRLLDHPK